MLQSPVSVEYSSSMDTGPSLLGELQGIDIPSLEHYTLGRRLGLYPGGKSARILSNHFKGIIVNGDHNMGFQQLDCPECIVRPHRKVVTNGQDGHV